MTDTETRCLCEQMALDNIPTYVARAALWMGDADRDPTQEPPHLTLALLSAAVHAEGIGLLRFVKAYPEYVVATHILRDHEHGRDVLRAITERTTP